MLAACPWGITISSNLRVYKNMGDFPFTWESRPEMKTAPVHVSGLTKAPTNPDYHDIISDSCPSAQDAHCVQTCPTALCDLLHTSHHWPMFAFSANSIHPKIGPWRGRSCEYEWCVVTKRTDASIPNTLFRGANLKKGTIYSRNMFT